MTDPQCCVSSSARGAAAQHRWVRPQCGAALLPSLPSWRARQLHDSPSSSDFQPHLRQQWVPAQPNGFPSLYSFVFLFSLGWEMPAFWGPYQFLVAFVAWDCQVHDCHAAVTGAYIQTWSQGEMLASQSKDCPWHSWTHMEVFFQPLFTHNSSDCKEKPVPDVPSD